MGRERGEGGAGRSIGCVREGGGGAEKRSEGGGKEGDIRGVVVRREQLNGAREAIRKAEAKEETWHRPAHIRPTHTDTGTQAQSAYE